jgi:hypothetical protein
VTVEPNESTPATPAARLVRDLAAETLDLVAWILTPEDGYEPVPDPIEVLLRAAACRLQRHDPESGPVLCAQVAEAAASAAAYVLAVRSAPADPQAPAGSTSPLARLQQLPRDELPELLHAAARSRTWTQP